MTTFDFFPKPHISDHKLEKNEKLSILHFDSMPDILRKKDGSQWSDLAYKFISITERFPISIEGEQAWLDFLNDILKTSKISVPFPKSVSEYTFLSSY